QGAAAHRRRACDLGGPAHAAAFDRRVHQHRSSAGAALDVIDVAATLGRYDQQNLALGAVGSHSALEVAAGARARGLPNVIVTAKGRDQTYVRHFKTQGGKYPRGCVDETIEVGAFPDMLQPAIQTAMLQRNVIFVPNRSFEVYLHQRFSYDEIENGMLVPFF